MDVGFAFPACLGAKEQICSLDGHLDDINLTFIDCHKLSCGKQALRNLLSISNRRSFSASGREVDYGYNNIFIFIYKYKYLYLFCAYLVCCCSHVTPCTRENPESPRTFPLNDKD